MAGAGHEGGAGGRTDGRGGALGDGRVATDVRHQHGHVQLLGLADGDPFASQLVGEAAGKEPAQRLALLLTVDDRLVEDLGDAGQIGNISGAYVIGALLLLAVAPFFWFMGASFMSHVSSLAGDPVDPLTADATYSTYNFGAHVGHVFKTTDGGASWSRLDHSLPDMPVHSIVVHPTQPDTLYIGTELGVFVTTDGGANWMRENTGFANVITEHLVISNGRLFAFTHGRSAWSVTLAQ